MIWLVRRMFVLGLMLTAICAIVVLVARQNPAPDTLQTLGFDVCEGDPCWRGIKPGMSWDKVQQYQSFPNTDGRIRTFPVKLLSIDSIWFEADESAAAINSIIVHYSDGPNLPLTLGEIVNHYGPPCRVAVGLTNPNNAQSYWVDLFYPTINVTFSSREMDWRDSVRFRKESRVIGFGLSSKNSDFCSLTSPFIGQWHGFMSIGRYFEHFEQERTSTLGP